MMSPDERRAVLQFATGLSSPPAGGFRNLVGYMGDAVPFTLGELAMPRRDEVARCRLTLSNPR